MAIKDRKTRINLKFNLREKETVLKLKDRSSPKLVNALNRKLSLTILLRTFKSLKRKLSL